MLDLKLVPQCIHDGGFVSALRFLGSGQVGDTSWMDGAYEDVWHDTKLLDA